MTSHTALKVWQVLDDLWRAPCSCGDSWAADTKVKANRLRNKHIHACAVQARKTKGRCGMTKVYFDIGGEPVPAEECMWVWIAPCGCECAWAVAEDYCHSADEAWDNFSGSKAARRRDEKLGFQVEIKRHKDIRVSDKCPHIPRFGVPPRPEVDGHTWAVKDRARVQHLVPLVIGKNSYGRAPDGGLVLALCGRSDAYFWSTDRCAADGLVECASCLKASRDRLAGAA
jgi:hypothetical protein